MDPKSQSRIEAVAETDPIAAYALFMGIPTIPVSFTATATFNSFDPTQVAVASGLDQTIAQRTWIKNMGFTIALPNAFGGNVLQPQYVANLKASPGILAQIEVYAGPRYVVNQNYAPIELLCQQPFFNDWVAGWPLLRQQNIQVSFLLANGQYANLTDPNEPPLIVTMAFNGYQFLDTSLEDLSPDCATMELEKAGFWVPKRIGCREPQSVTGFVFGMGKVAPGK